MHCYFRNLYCLKQWVSFSKHDVLKMSLMMPSKILWLLSVFSLHIYIWRERRVMGKIQTLSFPGYPRSKGFLRTPPTPLHNYTHVSLGKTRGKEYWEITYVVFFYLFGRSKQRNMVLRMVLDELISREFVAFSKPRELVAKVRSGLS